MHDEYNVKKNVSMLATLHTDCNLEADCTSAQHNDAVRHTGDKIQFIVQRKHMLLHYKDLPVNTVYRNHNGFVQYRCNT
jgi:hypothetical protein